MSSLGLVLSGGGARAAYQAGVIAAIADICSDLGISQPFDFYTGLSAGAINAAMITATESCNIRDACENLTNLWSRVESQQVYLTDPLSLSMGGLHWIADLSLGGVKKSSPGKSLLNNVPLKKLISDNCHFENIQRNLEKKRFRGLAISALDYFSTCTITFLQSQEEIPLWKRPRRQAEQSILTTDHILASSAIPLLFPPVFLDNRYFGDGCIRNQSPCGPAISMGAQKIIAIGVRSRQEICYSSPHINRNQSPTVGRVVSVLLNAVMMDGMEMDMERLDRINTNISKLSEVEKKNLTVRFIDHLWISPSVDIAEIAAEKVNKLPQMIRYLLKGLGSLQDASEIASFLLFEPSYCEKLIEIGFEDGMKQKEQIRRLLSSP